MPCTLLNALHVLTNLIVTISLYDRSYYLYFLDKETEAKRNQIICSRVFSAKIWNPDSVLLIISSTFSLRLQNKIWKTFPLIILTCNMKLQGTNGLISSNSAVLKVWSPDLQTPSEGSTSLLGIKTIFIILRCYLAFLHSHFLMNVQWSFPEPPSCVILEKTLNVL